MKKSLIVLVCSLLLLSCTVTEQASVSSGTKGTSLTDIYVEDYFIDVLTDFAEFMPASDESIMDSAVSTFAGQLNDAPSATGVAAVRSDANNYAVYFDFASFEKLAGELSGGKSGTIIKQSANSLSFYVDISNYEELEAVVPFLADPNIEVFLAKYNIGYSEEDYMDMIVFSLGEEAPESLRNSMITIDIQLPGKVSSVTGAVKTSDTSIRYQFPLIDFLLLSEPLSFNVTWK